MNILYMLEKQLKQNFRNVKAMIMMILFPIVLIVVLGTALSGLFENSSPSFKNIKVIYTNEGENDTAQAFKEFVKQGKVQGITFTQAKSADEAIESIKVSKFACYLKVNKESGDIQMYKNPSTSIEASMVQAFLGGFVQIYNARNVIAKENPAALNKIMAESNLDLVKIDAISQRKTPKSMDYYSVSIITLFILYSSLTGAFAVRGEKTMKTATRLMCTPIKKYEILVGKILGTFLIAAFNLLILIIFSKYVIKAEWGMHMGYVVLLLLAETLMSVSLGIGLAYIIKNEMAISAVIQTVIPFIAFLGGGYIPIDNFNKYLLGVSEFTPLRWINRSIFQVIYANDFSTVAEAVIINLLIAAIFVAASSILIRREA